MEKPVVFERLEKFYSRVRLEEADVLLHFGWGLGDCGEILQKRVRPGARIIVFEPDDALFRQSAGEPANRRIFEDPRFQFVTGSRVNHFFENWRLGGFEETDKFLWVELPGATPEQAAAAASLRVQFRAHLRDRAGNLLTHIKNGERYFQSAIHNFKYQSDADAGLLFGQFHNVPLVIVSAGPSLDRNIHHLPGFQDRCFILSVDTAVRPLLAAGITPHAAIIADPSELNARHIVGAIPESTYLIAEQAIHESAMQSATRRFLFGLGLFPDHLFAEFGFGKSRIEAWGSVATTALDLACRIGANPIIFIGQDFAYSWNRTYALNTIYNGDANDLAQYSKVRARDIWGDEVYTTENLIAYRDFFVRRMKQAKGIRFINATEGGILTQGAEILSLQDALDQCALRRININQMIEDCYRPSQTSPEALLHLRQVLVSRKNDCACLQGFIELTAKEHVLKRNQTEIKNRIQWGIEWINSRL
jgi:hypothetical protein